MKDNNYRFYILGTGSDYIKYMWNDVLKKENVFFLNQPMINYFPHKSIFYLIESKLYSFKLNLLLPIPGKRLWRKYYIISHINFDKNYKNIIIFSDVMRIQTDYFFWKKLRTNNNLKYCLLLLNSCEHDFNAKSFTVKRILKSLNMDMIFSFDNHDALQYNLHYFPSLYSKIQLPEKNIKKEYDFYFIGKKKNRYKIILDTYFTLKKRGFKCLFRITDVEENEMIKDDGIIYNQYIPYSEVIEEISKSNGIVDIKIPEQSGLSLRYFEAVQYNKVLLTNNPSVLNMPYYKKNHIYYFENIDDIPNIVKIDENIINYDYDGCYSPINLASMIENYLEGDDYERK